MTRIIETSSYGRRVVVTLEVSPHGLPPSHFTTLLKDYLAEAYGHTIDETDPKEIEKDIHDLFEGDGAAVLGVEVSG